MTDLSPILAELERLYDVAVDAFFPGNDTGRTREGSVYPSPRSTRLKQDRPIITLASKGRNRTRTGWYTPGVWSDSQEDVLAGLAGAPLGHNVKRAEIVVATELLANPVAAVAELCRQIVVHEQVLRRTYNHYPNPMGGILGSNGYYPENWSRLAHNIGCKATVDPEQPSRGWSKLTPGPVFIASIGADINTRVFDVARSNTAPLLKPGSRMKKWKCNCSVVRCATRLTGFCIGCSTPFTWAETNEPNPYEAPREQNSDDALSWPPASVAGLDDAPREIWPPAFGYPNGPDVTNPTKKESGQ